MFSVRVFPPLPRPYLSLQKVILEKVRVIVILVWWPLPVWWVLPALVDLPVLLPEHDGVLPIPDGLAYPNVQEFHLGTWRVSGGLAVGQEFR